MIKINKNERDYLVSKGFKFGSAIHRTYSHHPTYYVTENDRVLKILYDYRDKVVSKER